MVLWSSLMTWVWLILLEQVGTVQRHGLQVAEIVGGGQLRNAGLYRETDGVEHSLLIPSHLSPALVGAS